MTPEERAERRRRRRRLGRVRVTHEVRVARERARRNTRALAREQYEAGTPMGMRLVALVYGVPGFIAVTVLLLSPALSVVTNVTVFVILLFLWRRHRQRARRDYDDESPWPRADA